MDNKNEENNIPKFKEPLKPVVVEEKKKTNKTPIIVSILLVIVLIIGVILGIKYYMDSTKKTNNNSQNEVDNKTTLSENEINNYLSYIPLNLIYDSIKEPYFVKRFDVSTVDKEILLDKVLKDSEKEDWENITCDVRNNCLPNNLLYIDFDYQKDGNIYTYPKISNDNVNKLLKQQYNLTLDDIDIELSTSNKDFYNVGVWCMISFDNGFLHSQCRGWEGREIVYDLEKYEVTNEEITIYSRTIISNIFGWEKSRDLYTGKEIKDLGDLKLEEYIKLHKNEFTLYKHTFKKNELGYYWYSTEVIKEGNNSIEEKPNDSLTFNDEELEKYLEYVPLYMIYDDVNYPFHITKFDLNNVSKENIFDTAFLGADKSYWTEATCNLVDNCLPEDLLISDFYKNKENNVYTYSQISNSNVDLLLHTKYNLSLKDLNFKLSDNKNEFYYIGKACKISFDNAFLTSQCRGSNGQNILYVIDNYKATSEELDIYSKVILTSSFGNDKDLYTGEDIVIDSNINTKDYVLQHMDDFTLYKHTFKKNDTGYYWYSTEVVS